MEGRADFNNDACRRVGGVLVDTATWPSPDEGALASDVRQAYIARKLAITLFLKGCSDAEIKGSSGIGKKQAYRLIRERCLLLAEDGRPYGWRGLIRYEHIRKKRRIRKVRVDQFGCGATGAFTALLERHPDLASRMARKVTQVGSNTRLKAEKRTIASITRWFLNELRSLGYEERGDWPFNTQCLAYWSVYRYARDLLARSPKVATYISGGADAVKKLKSGDGSQRPPLSFMERVEMDSHKIDGRFCVSVPTPSGEDRPRIVHRIWVTVILEVLSRAVLGYHLSFGREVNKDDVLRAIKSALTQWKPRQVSFSDKAYLAGAGLPSVLGAEFTGLCWDETSVDGALAETCETIRTLLKDAVGSTLRSPDEGYSARRSKDDRPYIESFFRTLGERGFQKMSNTTGGNPGDTKGRAPELVAVNSMFQIEYAEELLDVLICNYNATPHSAHGAGRSPLAQFRFLAERYPERVRVCSEQTVTEYFSTRKLCKVRGGGSTGKLPYVEFFHARYTNELLHGRFDLVGKQIWVINHLDDDARVAMASTQDGRSLGILRAAPPWHQTPHSLAVRRGIKQLHDRHQFLLLNGADGVETFLDFVESQPSSQLPVYPAYLEARRILSEAAKSIETASIHKAALNKAFAPRASTTENSKDSADESTLAKEAFEQTLPPMRKAISR